MQASPYAGVVRSTRRPSTPDTSGTEPKKRPHRLSPVAVLATSFLVGAVPFSGWAARLVADVDLREIGSGTVSGTGLYEAAGFAPLAVAGTLEVCVGAVGPLLAGRDRPMLGAVAGGLAITGHNWSPFLAGAGGRGISTVLGSTLVLAPEGTVVVATGLGAGRLARHTALGCFLALVALFPILTKRRGAKGAITALCIGVPVLTKRVMGNSGIDRKAPPAVYLRRLVFDRDG